MKILLVEDDPIEAETVAAALRRDHENSWVGSGEKATSFLRSNEVDLVVLDWQLPSMNGLNLLQWIRSTLGHDPIVLVLTCRAFEVDIVRALEAGADEYMVKPARSSELTARANALSRRLAKKMNVSDVLSVGEYELNLRDRSVSLRSQKIALTMKEFILTAHFFRNINKIISRDCLSTLAWGRVLDSTSRTVDAHVYRLRQKLGLRPENGMRLTAIYAHGYRLEELNSPIARSNIHQMKDSALFDA